MSNLMLHAGAQRVELSQVMEARAPEPTETWFPISYGDLVGTAKESLTASGLSVVEEDYAFMSGKGDERDDAMFFGVLTLQGKEDYALTLGLRSSYNQRFAAAIAAGSRVFVCDNMAFSGEVRINRKQTKFAYRDLVRMVMETMGRLGAMWKTQEQRFDAYKGWDLTDAQVHDILIRSLDAKVMATSYVSKVLEQWRKPAHDDFLPRTAWSLFNAYTEVFKQTNPLDLTGRTTRLQGLLDTVVEADYLDVTDVVEDEDERDIDLAKAYEIAQGAGLGLVGQMM